MSAMKQEEAIQQVIRAMMERVLDRVLVTDPFIAEKHHARRPLYAALVPDEIFKSAHFERRFVTPFGHAWEQVARVAAQASSRSANVNHMIRGTVGEERQQDVCADARPEWHDYTVVQDGKAESYHARRQTPHEEPDWRTREGRKVPQAAPGRAKDVDYWKQQIWALERQAKAAADAGDVAKVERLVARAAKLAKKADEEERLHPQAKRNNDFASPLENVAGALRRLQALPAHARVARDGAAGRLTQTAAQRQAQDASRDGAVRYVVADGEHYQVASEKPAAGVDRDVFKNGKMVGYQRDGLVYGPNHKPFTPGTPLARLKKALGRRLAHGVA